MEERAEQPSQWDGHDDVGKPALRVVDDEEGYRCDDGYRQLVSPTDVEDVIEEPEHCRHQEGEQRRQVHR